MEFIGDNKDRANWSKHFIQVKSKIKQPKRTHTVNVLTKKGQKYSYKYADLSDVDKAVTDACREVKDKEGNVMFGYFFDIENGTDGVTVQTIMVDISGCAVKSDKVWFQNSFVGDAQQTAGLISYAKRYSLSAAFGVASEEDDDAQNLKPSDNRPRVRVLDKDELDHYEVTVYGNKHLLIDIWNDYLENKDSDTLRWLLSQKDPQTSQAIKQLVDHYNLVTKIENAKKQKAITKKVESKPEVNQKAEEESQNISKTNESKGKSNDNDEDIKQLVDGADDSNKLDKGSEAADVDIERLNLF